MTGNGITPAQYQNMIPVELGDKIGILRANMDLLWKEFEGFGTRCDSTTGITTHNYYLQYLHCKAKCIEILLGNLDEEPSFPITKNRESRVERRRKILDRKLDSTLRTIRDLDKVAIGTNKLAQQLNINDLTPNPRDIFYGPGSVTKRRSRNPF